MTRDDLRTIGLGLFVAGWFILPLLVFRANRWMRKRETRELQRPGFPVSPIPPTNAPEQSHCDD